MAQAEFRQEAPAASTIDIDIPGMAGAVARVPADATPDQIADVLNTARQTHGAQDVQPGTMQALPSLLSTGAGIGTSLATAGNPFAVGAASAGGEALGRFGQNVYGQFNPPQAEFKRGGAVHRFPLQPLPTPVKDIAKESGAIGLLSGAAEAVFPKLGPAAAFAANKLGLPSPKRWLAEKLLYPEKAAPDTKEMLDVDQLVRGAGGPGLPISRLGGFPQRFAPKTMEAIAHGGGSLPLMHSLEESQKALQRQGEAWKQQWGLPTANDIGTNLIKMMDTSYEQNIGRVQDQAYNTIRQVLPKGQAIVNAAPLVSRILTSGTSLTRDVLGELQTIQRTKPEIVGPLLQKLQAAQGQAAAAAKGEAPTADLSHWLSFDEAVELRSALYKIGRTRSVDSREEIQAAKAAQAIGVELSSTIREGLTQINPRLAGIHARADKVVSGIKDTFVNDEILRFQVNLRKDPYNAMKELLKPGNAEQINRVRAYLEPHKARLGQSTFGGEWQKVKDWFSAELIQEVTENVKRVGGPEGGIIRGDQLASKLNEYNRDTISAIWGDKGETFRELKLLARGLESTAEQPTGIGKIAIQLALPGAVGGVIGGGIEALSPDATASSIGGAAALGGAAIIMTPQIFGAILTNPSLLKHFRTGVWEYRKYGVFPESLRTVIRQAGTQSAYRNMSSYGMPSQSGRAGLPTPPPTDLPFDRPLPHISAR